MALSSSASSFACTVHASKKNALSSPLLRAATASVPHTCASCRNSHGFSQSVARKRCTIRSPVSDVRGGLHSLSGPHLWRSSRSPSHTRWQATGKNNGSGRNGRGNGEESESDSDNSDSDEDFADVEKQLMDYFTFKAVRTVLHQLLEMNPSQYYFLYNFTVNNKLKDAEIFIRTLVQERQELGERVMITRVYLFDNWTKRYSHSSMHEAIKAQNLELLREHLAQVVVFKEGDEDEEGERMGEQAGKEDNSNSSSTAPAAP